jgi:hypothetical protein
LSSGIMCPKFEAKHMFVPSVSVKNAMNSRTNSLTDILSHIVLEFLNLPNHSGHSRPWGLLSL